MFHLDVVKRTNIRSDGYAESMDRALRLLSFSGSVFSAQRQFGGVWAIGYAVGAQIPLEDFKYSQ